MRSITDIIDEHGVLHMCKKCNFVLVAGNKNDKVLITRYYRNQPIDTKFVVCDGCS